MTLGFRYQVSGVRRRGTEGFRYQVSGVNLSPTKHIVALASSSNILSLFGEISYLHADSTCLVKSSSPKGSVQELQHPFYKLLQHLISNTELSTHLCLGVIFIPSVRS